MPSSLRLSAALALVVAAAASASADDIQLTNGGKLEGKARRVGDEVIVEGANGEVRLAAKDVKSITVAPTRIDAYRERLARLDAKDAAQVMALADWCREQKLAREETKHLRDVIALEPDNAAARARLGFVRHDGRWMTDAEYHEARGFVRVGDAWVSRDEVARREEERRASEALRTHTKRIRDCIAKMSSPRRKVRLDGRIALQEYAERIGDPALGQFASEVASYYNESWRAVKAEWEGGGTATVEVRATKAELKRPIPEISTSLGGFSTPVRIQLPETSIVSVRTTARVPITIELDE